MTKKTDQITFDPTSEQSAMTAAEARAANDGTLPPPGAARTEELSRKAERLIQAAAKLLEQMDIGVADTSQIEIDREVRAALNEMCEVYISNRQPEYAYSWIFRDPTNEFGGRFVRKMQALGWEIIRGDMPEAQEHKSVTGERWVADCLAMRIRLDRHMLLEKRDKLLRDAQQAGIVARIADLAERAGTRLVDYNDMPGIFQSNLQSQAQQRRTNLQQRALRDFHRLNRGGRIDAMLKQGRIPGIPAPGAGD